MFIISTDKWTVYLDGWKPKIVKTWISGVETCILRGTAEEKVEELKVRLRYSGVRNSVTSPTPTPKKQSVSTRSRKKV